MRRGSISTFDPFLLETKVKVRMRKRITAHAHLKRGRISHEIQKSIARAAWRFLRKKRYHAILRYAENRSIPFSCRFARVTLTHVSRSLVPSTVLILDVSSRVNDSVMARLMVPIYRLHLIRSRITKTGSKILRVKKIFLYIGRAMLRTFFTRNIYFVCFIGEYFNENFPIYGIIVLFLGCISGSF